MGPGEKMMTKEDWDAAYDERAGILEYDEGLTRQKAETLAMAQTFTKYGPRPKMEPRSGSDPLPPG
jgi:hypothetical protein